MGITKHGFHSYNNNINHAADRHPDSHADHSHADHSQADHSQAIRHCCDDHRQLICGFILSSVFFQFTCLTTFSIWGTVDSRLMRLMHLEAHWWMQMMVDANDCSGASLLR